MKPLYIRPRKAFKLLGTALVLDPNTVYPAVHARNVSDWKARGLIYVGSIDGIMLENSSEVTEYDVVANYQPQPDA